MRISIFLFVVGALLGLPSNAQGATEAVSGDLAAMKLVALEPVAGQGVIRLPDGEMLLVAEGESLPGTEALVEEVLEDRLVLREELGGEPPQWRLIWMFQAESGGESSRFQILDPVPPKEEPVLKPRGSEEEGGGEVKLQDEAQDSDG